MASQRAQADLMKDALPCDGFRRDTNDEAEHSSSPVEELCANQLLLVDLLSGHALEFRFRVHHEKVCFSGLVLQPCKVPTPRYALTPVHPHHGLQPSTTSIILLLTNQLYNFFSQTKGKMIDAAHTFILYSFETGGPLAGAAQGIASVGSVSLLVLGSQKWMERRGGTLDASMPNGGRR
eukprot:g22797.t1